MLMRATPIQPTLFSIDIFLKRVSSGPVSSKRFFSIFLCTVQQQIVSNRLYILNEKIPLQYMSRSIETLCEDLVQLH